MPRDLPSGTVTFLFTDVEGSPRPLHELGPEGSAQAEHRRVLSRHHAETIAEARDPSTKAHSRA